MPQITGGAVSITHNTPGRTLAPANPRNS